MARIASSILSPGYGMKDVSFYVLRHSRRPASLAPCSQDPAKFLIDHKTRGYQRNLQTLICLVVRTKHARLSVQPPKSDER
jgi:hypothetical protein